MQARICAITLKQNDYQTFSASALAALAFVSLATPARAGSVDGSAALAPAAIASEKSSQVKAVDRLILLKLLNGQLTVPPKKITVVADAIGCKTSNVDITLNSCDLSFGTKKIVLRGAKARELYATLAEAGAPSDGGAGSLFEALSALDCAIDTAEVKQKAGGGASGKYDPPK